MEEDLVVEEAMENEEILEAMEEMKEAEEVMPLVEEEDMVLEGIEVLKVDLAPHMVEAEVEVVVMEEAMVEVIQDTAATMKEEKSTGILATI